MQQRLRIVFAGGGTAGHLYPAFNLAAQFEKEGACTFLFFGAKKGIEAVKVPERGYQLVLLNIRGFQRRFSFQNFLFPFRLLGSLLKSRKGLKHFKPDLVIGTGGYVMGPVLKMAVKLNIPVYIQEQNSFPGVTTRLLAKEARAVFIAYETAKRFLAKEGNLIVCGNPVNMPEKIRAKAPFLKEIGLSEKLKTILVFGGSQGAASINRAVKNLLEKFGLPQGVQLLWQTGQLQYKMYAKWLDGFNPENVIIKPFINDMWAAYAISECAVCRAGAMSISELAIAKLPAMLVPLKSAAGNHQFKNAEAMAKKDAAILVEDNEILADQINAQIHFWLENPDQLQQMKANLAQVAQPAASAQIVKEIKKTLAIKN